jgi:hypothetical protein
MTDRATARRRPRNGRIRQALREFMYGMAGYEFGRQAMEVRAALENVFMAITVGDMIGLPVLPPYYSLRLLPHVVPHVSTWKRRVLRERELTEKHDYDLHGV